jgi:hypothetical protein
MRLRVGEESIQATAGITAAPVRWKPNFRTEDLSMYFLRAIVKRIANIAAAGRAELKFAYIRSFLVMAHG